MDNQNQLEQRFLSELKSSLTEKSKKIELEISVINLLKKEGLIRNLSPRNISWYSVAALVLLSFVAGYFFSTNRFEQPISSNYMLLLYENTLFNPSTNYDLTQEYSDWLTIISKQGIEIYGEKLSKKSLFLSTKPDISDLELAGFFIFKASSHEQALEIATSMPHINYGGIVELKEIIHN